MLLDKRGFTVIEALIALALLALMTAIISRAASQGAVAVNQAREREDLIRLARSTLARVGSELELKSASYSGRETSSGFSWKVEIIPYAEPAEQFPRSRFNAYWVTATVESANESRTIPVTYSLRTIRTRARK